MVLKVSKNHKDKLSEGWGSGSGSVTRLWSRAVCGFALWKVELGLKNSFPGTILWLTGRGVQHVDFPTP